MSELQQLRDRIDELEYLLGITGVVPEYFALEMAPARRTVLGLLIKRPLVTKEAIIIATRSGQAHKDDPNGALAICYVHHVRRFLQKRYSIKVHTAWGQGWFLDIADRKKLQQLFAQAEAA